MLSILNQAQYHVTSDQVSADDIELPVPDCDSARIAGSLMEIHALLPAKYSSIDAIREDPVLILENAADYLGELLNAGHGGPQSMDSSPFVTGPFYQHQPLTSSLSAYTEVVDAQSVYTPEMITPSLSACPRYHDVRSGYRDCADEVIRFLIQSEGIPENDPLLLDLKEHLRSKENSLVDITPNDSHATSDHNYCGEPHKKRRRYAEKVCMDSRNFAYTEYPRIVDQSSSCTCCVSNNNVSYDGSVDRPRCLSSLNSQTSTQNSEIIHVMSELITLLTDTENDDVIMDDEDKYEITDSEQ